MFVYPCHNCGRPRPIALTPTLPPCPACKDDTPPPAGVRKAIDDARAAVLHLPLRAKQLDAAERYALGAGIQNRQARWAWAGMAFPLIVFSFAGFAILQGGTWQDPEHRAELVWGYVLHVPLVLHIVFGWHLRRRLMRHGRDVRGSLQARQDLAGKFVCRTCGAPLHVATLDTPIVACAYCQCENLVDLAATTAAEELASFDTLEARVVASARRRRPRLVSFELYGPFVAGLMLLWGMRKLDAHLAAAHLPENRAIAYFGDRFERGATFDGRRYVPNMVTAVVDQFTAARNKDYSIPIELDSLLGKTTECGQTYGRNRTVTGVASDGWGRNRLDVDDGNRINPTRCDFW